MAARIPALRAALTPRFSCSIKRTRGNLARTRSAVSSVEPSSTTRISSGGRVWRRMDSSARVMTLARLNVGITTETVTISVCDTAVRMDGECEDEAVVPSGQLSVPDDADVISVKGHYIVPGFIDAHMHLADIRRGVLGMESWGATANLAYGVTTSFDPSSLVTSM